MTDEAGYAATSQLGPELPIARPIKPMPTLAGTTRSSHKTRTLERSARSCSKSSYRSRHGRATSLAYKGRPSTMVGKVRAHQRSLGNEETRLHACTTTLHACRHAHPASTTARIAQITPAPRPELTLQTRGLGVRRLMQDKQCPCRHQASFEHAERGNDSWHRLRCTFGDCPLRSLTQLLGRRPCILARWLHVI